MQQQPGINGFNAAMTGQDPSSPMTNPHMAMMNPVMQSQYTGAPPGMLNPANTMSADLKDAMRSFRDSLAFSFQSLNLTLSTLNQTVSTVGTKLGRMTPNTNDLSRNQYMQVGTPGVYLGAMSAGMANYIGNNNFGSLFSHYAPANVSPLEFYTERARELGLRSSNMALTGLGGLSEELVNYGASMWAGRKILGAMGIGAGGMFGEMGAWMLGSPIGVAASVGLSYLTDPIIEYGVRHNRDVAAMRRMSPRMGSGFDLRQSQRAIGGLEQLALRDTLTTNSLQHRMGLEGFKELTMMGLQGNMFQGSSADDLIKQVSSASFVVKFLAGVMGNKDVRETMTLVKQLKDMGVNVFQAGDFAKSLGMDAFKYGRTMGVDSGSLLNSAANMSMAAYGQFGNPAYLGIRQGMNNLAYMQELEKRGIMTPADIAAGGGAQNIGARMLGVQAGMMNSWNVGLPMLYAGWNGNTGFDQGRFNKAFAGGNYWGALAGATQNMLSGGIPGLTHVMMNKNNIMSSAAEQGVLDQNTLAMLDGMLRNTPGYNDPSIPLDQKESMAAYYLMQMSPQIFQTQIDPATAKALAKQVVSPSIQARVNAIAAGKARQGAFEYVSAGHGIGRFSESIGESWEKFKARVHDTYVSKPGRAIADFFSDRFEKMHGNPFLDNDYSMSIGMAAYNWGARNKQDFAVQRFSPFDFNDAFERLNDPTSAKHLFGRLFNRDLNYLEDALEYNLAVDNADLFKRMRDPNRMTVEDFAVKYRNLLGNNTVADIKRNYSIWEPMKQEFVDDITLNAQALSPFSTGAGSNELSLDFYRNIKKNTGVWFENYDLEGSTSPAAPLFRAARALRTMTEGTSAWDEGLNEVYTALRTAGLDPNNLNAKELFGSEGMKWFDPNTGKLALGGNIAAMTQNSFGPNFWSKSLGNKLSGLGTDASQRVKDYILSRYSPEGYSNDFALMGAIYGRTLLNDYAESAGTLPNSFQYQMFDPTMDKIRLNKSRMYEFLSESNMTPDMVRKWAMTSSGDEFNRVIDAITNYTTSVGDKSDGLTGTQLQSLRNGLSAEDKSLFNAFMGSAQTRSQARSRVANLLDSEDPRYKAILEGTGWTDPATGKKMSDPELVNSIVKGAFGQQLYDTYMDESVSVLKFLGIDANQYNAPDIRKNLSKHIKDNWSGRRDLSQEQRRILSITNKLESLSDVDFAKQIGKDVTDVNTPEKRAAEFQQFILGQMTSIAKDSERQENILANRKKTAIDTAVRMTAYGPVVATIDADMLTKVRDKVSSATTDYSKYSTGFTYSKSVFNNQSAQSIKFNE